MDIVVLFPLILLIGAMFVMTRSAKKKQQQALHMRDQVQPGTGIRTIGGLYARVKEVGDDTVLLELAPGVHALFAKNAIGAVLEDDEYEAIINPQSAEPIDAEATVIPDDASSLTGEADEEPAAGDDEKPSLRKSTEPAEDAEPPSGDVKDSKKDDEDGSK